MIEHIVWFEFKASESDESVAKLMGRLQGLQNSVPGISRLKVGKNFTDRSRGFTHALVVTLDSKDALDAYQVHPEHAAVARDLRAASEAIVAIDFEH